MKAIIATLVTLAAATPVLANDQLARSLGVEPGQYSLQQLVAIKSAQENEGNEGRVNLQNFPNLASRAIGIPVTIAPAAGN